MTLESFLKQFPFLARARDETQDKISSSTTPIGSLLNGEYSDQIKPIDDALAVLYQRFTCKDLKEQIQALFGAKMNEFNQGRTELLAFAFLERNSLLQDIGWPTDWPGHPPFDGTICIQPAERVLAFDVKSAINDGRMMLEGKSRKLIKEWRIQHKLPLEAVSFKFQGLDTIEEIGPSMEYFCQEFSKKLNAYKTFPGEPIELSLRSLKITIFIRAKSPFNGYSSYSCKFMDEEIQSISSTLKKHVCKKAKEAEENPCRFFLIYVCPAGCDGDIDPIALKSAFDKLNNNDELAGLPGFSRWLGLVMLKASYMTTNTNCYVEFNECPEWQEWKQIRLALEQSLNPSRWP